MLYRQTFLKQQTDLFGKGHLNVTSNEKNHIQSEEGHCGTMDMESA